MKRHPVRFLAAALAVAALVATAGCSAKHKDPAETGTTQPPASTESTTASVPAPDVTVSAPWARTSPAAATTGAVYMVLTATTDDTLTKVTVPAKVAASAEVHKTTDSGGQMSMEPVPSLPLPAGKAVTLEPGGYHIMLIDLAAPLTAGSTFDVTLTFEKAGEKTVSVPVRDA